MAEPPPGRRERPSTPGRGADAAGPRWYEFLLAAILAAGLAAAIAGAAWWSRGAGGWRGETAGDVFLIAMLAVAAAGAAAFVVYLFTRIPRRSGQGGTGEDETRESPAGVRLLGLAVLAVPILVAGWVYAPPALAYALAADLLYPAVFALALVLLFDKASRGWAVKSGAVSFREWLYCDAFAVLLVVGYLNLAANAVPEEYGAFFWDALHAALFVFAFWLVDRKFTRLRWLAGLAYLTLLPALHAAWASAAAAAPAEGAAPPAADPSWWSTPWPFIALGLAACAVEVVVLAAAGRADGGRAEDDRRQGAAGCIVKDAVFFVLYGGLLIAAAPAAGGGAPP